MPGPSPVHVQEPRGHGPQSALRDEHQPEGLRSDARCPSQPEQVRHQAGGAECGWNVGNVHPVRRCKRPVPARRGWPYGWLLQETQYSRWMACCRLAAKGRSLADSSYETEKQTILEFLNLQRRAEQPVINPSSLDIQVEDYVSPKYSKKSKGKVGGILARDCHPNLNNGLAADYSEDLGGAYQRQRPVADRCQDELHQGVAVAA